MKMKISEQSVDRDDCNPVNFLNSEYVLFCHIRHTQSLTFYNLVKDSGNVTQLGGLVALLKTVRCAVKVKMRRADWTTIINPYINSLRHYMNFTFKISYTVSAFIVSD